MNEGLSKRHRRMLCDVRIPQDQRKRIQPIRKLVNSKNICIKCIFLLLWSLCSFTSANADIGNWTSSGQLLSVSIGGKTIISRTVARKPIYVRRTNTFRRHPSAKQTLQDSFYRRTSGGVFTPPKFNVEATNFLRSWLFEPLFGRSKPNRTLELAGSYLPYMGRVQVALREQRWGSVCGDQWDANDATVACRELGFAVGGVIARPRMEFGPGIGPVVISKVRCRGDERSLSECRAARWNGVNPLPCATELSAAGIVCGCPLDVEPNVHTRCFSYTTFPYDSMHCRYSCRNGEILVGSRWRNCIARQTWSGTRPFCIRTTPNNLRHLCLISAGSRLPCLRQNSLASSNVSTSADLNQAAVERCIAVGCCFDHSTGLNSSRCYLPADSPCSLNPCLNGGSCRDYLDTTGYTCYCVSPFGGANCEYRRAWACGRPTIQPDIRTVRPQLRIFGGRSARPGSWPWVVQLRYNEAYFCTATLIAPQWIATAAHCLDEKGLKSGRVNDTRWKAVVGQHSRTNPEITSQTIGFYDVIIHNYTNIDIPRKDIALIKLNHPVVMGNVSGVICLPTTARETPDPGTKCWVAGWGQNTPTSREAPVLQQADIPVISNARCRMNNQPRRDYSAILDDVICAGYNAGGVDSCKGDSGGPMMCLRTDGTWYLAGIVSWGYSCADPNTPGVYTRVSHYLPWIYDVIRRH